jgi:hypothetical protein
MKVSAANASVVLEDISLESPELNKIKFNSPPTAPPEHKPIYLSDAVRYTPMYRRDGACWTVHCRGDEFVDIRATWLSLLGRSIRWVTTSHGCPTGEENEDA